MDYEVKFKQAIEDPKIQYQELASMLVQWRDDGMIGDQAYEIFKNIRETFLSEEKMKEVEVMEYWLNIAWGFCSPKDSIWPRKNEKTTKGKIGVESTLNQSESEKPGRDL